MTGLGEFSTHHRDGSMVTKRLTGNYPGGQAFVSAGRLGEQGMRSYLAALRAVGVRLPDDLDIVADDPLTVRHSWVPGPTLVEIADTDPPVFAAAVEEITAWVRGLDLVDARIDTNLANFCLVDSRPVLVDVLPPEADSSIAMLGQDEKPTETYQDIGGMDIQKQEIREAVELPLVQFDLYRQIGIDPPRGVLLYGPPGTGKTMLVKAVANATTASFIRVVGSEFVQKYLGEGPRMVRDVFRLARENAPAIIFIDEIDAIATKRFDAQTGADREVQRILLELLNQMDGFDQTSNVKVIMATNRADTLDPALLRPGRLDRKIEFPSLRDRRERRLIFSTIASKMSLSPEVDLDSLIVRNDPLSGAVIAAIMQEAGLRAVRKNRYNIIQQDLEDAYTSQVKGTSEHDKFDFYK